MTYRSTLTERVYGGMEVTFIIHRLSVVMCSISSGYQFLLETSGAMPKSDNGQQDLPLCSPFSESFLVLAPTTA